MRVVRVLLGVVAITLALPLLGGGTALWLLGQHRSAGGWFAGTLDQVGTPGYAVVVPDVDDLLRRDAPLLNDAATRLRISAGPAFFVGLAPRAALERYLDGVPYASLTRIRPALGPLPVTVSQIGGARRPPAVPAAQPFWVAASAHGTLDFSPGAVRGQRLALVVMRPDAAASLHASIEVAVRPVWLGVLTWASIVLGGADFAAGLALLCCPTRPREIVYVLPPEPRWDRPQPETAPAQGGAGSDPPAAEIVDVSALAATCTAPITPDFEWPPVPAVRAEPLPAAAPSRHPAGAGGAPAARRG
jgi:hypothetical protein